MEFGGVGQRFLGLARFGGLRIDTSAAILDELIIVLREDFDWEGSRLQFMRIELEKLTNVAAPSQSVNAVSDPDDNKILECALEADRNASLRAISTF